MAMNSKNERIRLISLIEFSKMHGWYAEVNVNAKVSVNNNLEGLSDEQLITIIHGQQSQ
jgi:hypothetical protein